MQASVWRGASGKAREKKRQKGGRGKGRQIRLRPFFGPLGTGLDLRCCVLFACVSLSDCRRLLAWAIGLNNLTHTDYA